MSSILQGTTPALKIKIKASDFAVTDVTKLELFIKNGSAAIANGLEDVTIDAEENTITKKFTEAETMALNPQHSMTWQCRFLLSDGNILGTDKTSIQIEDLMSREELSK